MQTQNEMIEEVENIKNNQNNIQGSNHKKEGISICLTAWRTQKYIEECLDSIEKQTYFSKFNNYEILLGIDACEKTLEKIKQIQHKYRNLRVFMMDHNVGTYVVSNTIMSIAKYNWLLRFDTDDIMNPDMVERVMKNAKEKTILQCSYISFGPAINHRRAKTNFAKGVIFMNKKTFDSLGGYKDFKCAADADFLKRAKKFGYTLQESTGNVYFKRRVHNSSLTLNGDTNLTSGKLRKQYHEQTEKDLLNGIITISMTTASYKEIMF